MHKSDRFLAMQEECKVAEWTSELEMIFPIIVCGPSQGGAGAASQALRQERGSTGGWEGDGTTTHSSSLKNETRCERRQIIAG